MRSLVLKLVNSVSFCVVFLLFVILRGVLREYDNTDHSAGKGEVGYLCRSVSRGKSKVISVRFSSSPEAQSIETKI